MNAHIELWTDQMVIFTLDNTAADYNGCSRLWASLLLNGQETNALPITLVTDAAAPGPNPVVPERPAKEELTEQVYAGLDWNTGKRV